jgi:hypothetical protein
MDERDLKPKEASVRLLVDQLDALLGEPLELSLEIAHLVGDVVHARPAAREELPDRGLIAERREQLDSTLADPDGRCLDALRGNHVAVLYLGTEKTPIRVDRFVEILDGHSEMVDPLRLHARGS